MKIFRMFAFGFCWGMCFKFGFDAVINPTPENSICAGRVVMTFSLCYFIDTMRKQRKGK